MAQEHKFNRQTFAAHMKYLLLVQALTGEDVVTPFIQGKDQAEDFRKKKGKKKNCSVE